MSEMTLEGIKTFMEEADWKNKYMPEPRFCPTPVDLHLTEGDKYKTTKHRGTFQPHALVQYYPFDIML